MIFRQRGKSEKLLVPSRRLLKCFGIYVNWYLRRHFHSVRIANAHILKPQETPLIIFVNHASWWDPLTCMLLAGRLFPTHHHYGPMDEAALARYPLLRCLGMFPVEEGTRRGAAQFLRASIQILSSPQAVLWLTPQGAFTDVRNRPLQFKPGLAALLKRRPDATAIPLAIEYTFWDERLPEILVNAGEPLLLDPAAPPEGIPHFLASSLQAAQDSLAALSQARSSNAFSNLLAGRTGVGLAYDTARRLSALFGGEKFRSEHTPANAGTPVAYQDADDRLSKQAIEEGVWRRP